ncbi:hypothetical protein [Demequina sp. SO4-18]|uniref:hypothetical protein n=1 Tax=Demequina sp. SO4-18 TaxID=3401026 RepID=UPI003B5B6FCB
MTMDISDTLAPDSTQLDAVELAGSPRTFRISGVKQGDAEQPVHISFDGFPRLWKPGKSMRRVLAACWGTDASVYVGRSVRLYCDESVMFGKDRVMGTRIEAMSHIDKPKAVPLLVSRGKSAMFTVQPLKVEDAPTEPTEAEVAACTDDVQLRDWWKIASPERRAQIEARGRELTAASTEGGAS